MKIDAKYIDSVRRLLNPFARSVAPEVGDRGLAIMQVKGVDTTKREVTGLLNNASVDRYGEVVLPEAFRGSLPSFMRNPKFLAGHVYQTEDGSPTSIGTWINMDVTKEGLVGTARFLPPGDTLSDKWWFRFEHQAARSFSVGFIAQEWEMRTLTIDGEPAKVRHFTKAELLEVSAVEIPANADALLRSVGGAPGSSQLLEGVTTELRSFDGLDAIVAKAVEGRFNDLHSTIKTMLSADAGSEMCRFIRDIVEATLEYQREISGEHEHDVSTPGSQAGNGRTSKPQPRAVSGGALTAALRRHVQG